MHSVDSELNSFPIDGYAKSLSHQFSCPALACMPKPCQNNELCLIPIILWQMPPCVAILYTWEFEQNGGGLVFVNIA